MSLAASRAVRIAAMAAVLTVPCAVRAADVSLEQVVTGSLRSNSVLQHEDERVNRAAGQVREAQGAFDWTPSAEIGPETLYVARADAAGTLTNDLETVRAWHTTVGVSHLFRNGVSVAPGVSFYADTDVSAAQTQGVTRTIPALNLSIPLLRDFGENNTAAANERAALAVLEGTKAGRAFIAQRNVHDAVQIFWRCLAARRHREIYEAGKGDADADVTMLRDQVQRGQAEPTVLDRALARQAVQQVNLTQLIGIENRCRRDLSLYVGAGPDGSLPAADGDFPQLQGPDALNQAQLAQKALETRQDLEALAQYRAAEAERVKGAQNSTQPKVDLYVDTTRILLRLSQPLGNDIARGREAQAAAAEGDARLNFEQLQTAIRQDVAEQLRLVQEGSANWTALNQSVRLLEGVVADAARRVQAGVLTSQDYRNMQDELAAARNQVIDAQLEYASGLAGLRLAMGAIDTEAPSPAGVASGFRSLP